MAVIAAAIPAFQEEKHIADVARRTLQQVGSVVVVDDGSTDATAANARAVGAEVIVHPVNRGKGDAIKTGLRHWLERGADYVVLLDGDGQHLPEEIPRFVETAERTDAKLLIGSRMHDVTRMPPLRRAVNRYMSRKISQLCGRVIADSQCGFRMLHRDLIPDVLGGGDRFDYETEMLIFASRRGYPIESVPITTVYADEVSSINPIRDTVRFFKMIRRYSKPR